MRAIILLPALIALLLLDVGTAVAHRLNVFAYAEGATIVGSAYFSGGAPAGADVTVYDPGGTVLGRTTTDAEGAFTFDATVRTDHHITVETADGHAATFVVTAAELPASLPPGADGPAPEAAADDGASPQTAGPPAQVAVAGMTIDNAALEAMILRTVQQQVRPLRQQLAAYGEEIRLRDIIGGIGYILGIFGLVAYAMVLRKRADPGRTARDAAGR